MTLNELIGQLQELVDGGHGDYQVLAVYQPNYPLQEKVAGVWFDDEPENEDEDENENKFIYIVVDGHQNGVSPYGPRAAFC